MPEPHEPPNRGDSLTTQLRFDRLCDEFENAWLAGQPIRIEDLIGKAATAAPEAQAELLRELLALEIAMRRGARELPKPEDYLSRFIEHAALVQQIFESSTQPNSSGELHHQQRPHASIDNPTVRFSGGLDETSNFILKGHSAGNYAKRTDGGDAGIETLPLRLGRYSVTERLGAGAFGVVYRGRDPDLLRDVAIKVPLADRLNSNTSVQLYLDEARTAVRLDHHGIVPVYDCGQTDDGRPFVVSKFIKGENLRQALETRRFPATEAASLVANVAEALHHAHSVGIIHRDIKPDNILLGESGQPMLTDFGMALRPESFAQGASLCGTVNYMSPEQAAGRADKVDGRSDIYSLGVVLYELLTGQRPYRGQHFQSVLSEIADESTEVRPPRQIEVALPQELERICLKALAKRSGERYTTAADLAADLRQFSASAQADTRPQRRILLQSAAISLIGIAAAMACVSFWKGTDNPQTKLPTVNTSDAAQQPVRVKSVEIQQLVLNKQNEHERHGLVLQDLYRLHEGDAVQFRARLSRPAYCFWLAFRPDGVEELCYPQDADQPPPLTDEPAYPLLDPEQVVYGLTDGVGLQAFVLVVSEQPLPSYNTWRSARGTSPWQPTTPTSPTSAAIHHHDSRWEEVFALDRKRQTRGAGERWQGARSELDALVSWLRTDQQLTTIDAWALPVLPKKN